MYLNTVERDSFSIQLREKQVIELLGICSKEKLKKYLKVIDEPHCSGTYGFYLIQKIAVVKKFVEEGKTLHECQVLYKQSGYKGILEALRASGFEENHYLQELERRASDIALTNPMPNYSNTWCRFNPLLLLLVFVILLGSILGLFGLTDINNKKNENQTQDREMIGL